MKFGRRFHWGSRRVTQPEEDPHAHVHLLVQLDGPRNPLGQGRTQACRRLQGARQEIGSRGQAGYLTSGEHDFVAIVETPNGDNVAKWAMALGAQGNLRSRTVRAWPEAEFLKKLISELP
jgi:uncharacterized protein with GYD domain